MRNARLSRILPSVVASLAILLSLGCAALAPDAPRPNLAWPTSGGQQFWTDVFWSADWRIQENAFTGHCRLLDPRSIRRAWGSRAACRAAHRALCGQGVDEPDEHLVILLHGLGRTRDSLADIDRALTQAGFATARLSYASTRAGVAAHADRLTNLLDALTGVERVSFVTHSLGALVVRESLARRAAWGDRLALGRLVMIAPPSRGSAMARALLQVPGTAVLLGPSARDCARAAFPPPPLPFATIAAVRGDGRGWNPILVGDDDGIVAEHETHLRGEDDWMAVRGVHTFVMQDPDTVGATLRFLEHGAFGPERGP
ncbi:MAG: hypothetical protein GY711_10215 [bacterium]|nr:hypothetical protein [bacterium]